MDRRSFLKVSSASLVAMNAENILGKNIESPISEEKGIHVRFLGTGAADWNGRDNRGELRRLSSMLVDGSFLFDLTPGNIEMIPSEYKPETIFYTHSHGDHYHPESALKLGVKNVYVSHTWYDMATKDFQQVASKMKVSMPEIKPLSVSVTLIVIISFLYSIFNNQLLREHEQQTTCVMFTIRDKMCTARTGGRTQHIT